MWYLWPLLFSSSGQRQRPRRVGWQRTTPSTVSHRPPYYLVWRFTENILNSPSSSSSSNILSIFHCVCLRSHRRSVRTTRLNLTLCCPPPILISRVLGQQFEDVRPEFSAGENGWQQVRSRKRMMKGRGTLGAKCEASVRKGGEHTQHLSGLGTGRFRERV